jgi:subtilisin family serine protease
LILSRAIAVALLTTGATLVATVDARPADNRVAASFNSGRSHVPHELLVQFKANASDEQRNNALARANSRAIERIRTAHSHSTGHSDAGELHLVGTDGRKNLLDTVAELQSDEAVEFAEPNWVYVSQVVSNDPQVTSGGLWGMYGGSTTPANVYGSGAAAAWAAGKTCNSNIYVGVIDEGIMTSHTDLASNIWINSGEIAGNGIDDDGNGLIDDLNGFDFANNDGTVFDGTTDDHGTHVAGTIAGVGGNGVGVAGVCWQAKLISAKFLGRRGGTTANAIKAVDYLTNLKLNRGINIVASNNSWGGGGFSQALFDAIQRSANADIVFVAAAGNGGTDGVGDNNDATPSYPAGYLNANVISVAAIDKNGNLAGFSNFGATSVDIGAPGVAIVSTVPGKAGASSYASYNGTSMATPHVTGAVALYRSINPSATAVQTKAAVLSAAVPTPSLQGKTSTGGRLSVSGF